VGDSGTIETSPDGVTWTARTAAGAYSGGFMAVTWAGDKFVAVGQSGEIQTSPDGITWTARTAAGGFSSYFRGIEWSGTMVLAVGDSSEIQTSPDGITWTARTADGSPGTLYAPAWSGDAWTVVGVGGAIQTSPDGITWTARTAAGGFSSAFLAATWTGALFVAVGAAAEIQTSPDGVAWTQHTAAGGYAKQFTSARWSGSRLVLAGDDGGIQASAPVAAIAPRFHRLRKVQLVESWTAAGTGSGDDYDAVLDWSGRTVDLRRSDLDDLNSSDSADAWSVSRPPRYRLIADGQGGSSLYFDPAPTSAVAVLVWYVGNPLDLSSSDAVALAPNWAEFLVVDAACAFARRDRDTSSILAELKEERARLEAAIRAQARDRDDGQPLTLRSTFAGGRGDAQLRDILTVRL